MPSFKNQLHFYGYDGRGNDPTRFDCIYTYNLGLTAFSLIANGATGQMAAIKNLDQDFSKWEPIGIPIAPLMHLEERKGKLALVIEKSIVDVNSVAFRVVQAQREKWLAATQVPLAVFVGLNDTAELPLSLIPGQKGRTRYVIASNWVKDMAAFAEANGLESRFELGIIPGQGHGMSGLIPFSQEALVSE